MPARIFTIVAVLSLGGCAHHWVHEGPGGDFKRDAFECNGTSYKATGDFETKAALNQQCMEARGWTVHAGNK